MWKRTDTTESTDVAQSSENSSPRVSPAPPTPVSPARTSTTLGHSVVIGQQAAIKAQIFAKDVVVLGKVVGDINASTKIEIRPQGKVEGDLAAPAVAIAEGATFRGNIDMSHQSAESAA